MDKMLQKPDSVPESSKKSRTSLQIHHAVHEKVFDQYLS